MNLSTGGDSAEERRERGGEDGRPTCVLVFDAVLHGSNALSKLFLQGGRRAWQLSGRGNPIRTTPTCTSGLSECHIHRYSPFHSRSNSSSSKSGSRER